MSDGDHGPHDFDIVVLGATGFVGRLVAAHLAAHAPEGAEIALAGRDPGKLERVRRDLPERAHTWPLLFVDTGDGPAVEEMARHTMVVLTTVGPYAAYGLPVVQACADAGTHYVDLTGEALFVRDSADRYAKTARQNGARIVHACGFDSVPSDLSVHLLAQRALADRVTPGDAGLGEVRSYMSMRGGFSGGTLASMKGQVDAVARFRARARVLLDPYGLSPDREAEPEPRGVRMSVGGARHSDEADGWIAPFVMAPFNAAVVRRSNALTGWAYGRTLRYREVQRMGRGLRAQAMARAVQPAAAALLAGLAMPPSRFLLDRVLPKPGDGPSDGQRASGFFELRSYAELAASPGTVAYQARFGCDQDPGYDATAVMIGQSALALAFDQDRLPDRAGVLTPATALGDVLVDRLRGQGFRIDADRV